MARIYFAIVSITLFNIFIIQIHKLNHKAIASYPDNIKVSTLKLI